MVSLYTLILYILGKISPLICVSFKTNDNEFGDKMIYDSQKGKTNILRDFASLLDYQMNKVFYVWISDFIYLCLEIH